MVPFTSPCGPQGGAVSTPSRGLCLVGLESAVQSVLRTWPSGSGTQEHSGGHACLFSLRPPRYPNSMLVRARGRLNSGTSRKSMYEPIYADRYTHIYADTYIHAQKTLHMTAPAHTWVQPPFLSASVALSWKSSSEVCGKWNFPDRNRPGRPTGGYIEDNIGHPNACKYTQTSTWS